MGTKGLAVQYLEGGPGVAAISARDAWARLRDTCELLPISYVLLGWNLSPALIDACREETARAGAKLLRWHPLLSGDGTFVPRSEWQTMGLDGKPVTGFQAMPEFTFVCPNRSAVREAVLDHLRDAIRKGDYAGVFLDRIRYPSPAADPARLLACFCVACHRAAAAEGLDLEAARRQIRRLLEAPERILAFLRVLLDPLALEAREPDPALTALRAFLDFRTRSVTRFIRAAADLIHGQGLEVGLDCFSPALTYMVGQALEALGPSCEWIKIMTYGHTLGPAGLPFELLGVVDWLVVQGAASESEAMEWLARVTHLPLPATATALRKAGLPPEALAREVKRARALGVDRLWAGVELVEMEGITNINRAQIAADLKAFDTAGVDGLVLSWDLWHIPPERLELVRAIYL